MILADTSAWIEWDRATGSSVDVRMTELVTSADELVVTEPVWMEVVAGAATIRRGVLLERLLARFQLIPFQTPMDFEGAVRIYRACRSVGVTPRGLLDCAIATVARRSGATLLSRDRDLIRVARVVGLELDPASLGAN